MSEWQPIETAPRDGERIIIAGEYPNGMTFVEESFWVKGIGRGHKGAWTGRSLDKVTHWQPMPLHPDLRDIPMGEPEA